MKLQASLQGLGPVFRVRVTVKNSGARVAAAAGGAASRAAGCDVAHAMVVITCDAGTHSVNDAIFKVCRRRRAAVA